MPRKRSKSSAASPRRALLVCAALLLVSAGFYFGFRVAQPPPPPDFDALRETPPAEETPQEPVSRRAEEPSTPAAPEARQAPPAAESLVVRRQPPPSPSGAPRVALVIDDLGRSLGQLESLWALDVALTYAVLPFEVRTPEVVKRLRQRGDEILCHLPMEAQGAANPGPGALRVSMSDPELRQATLAALEAVPGAIGVNNHMGSAVVTDQRSMSAILGVLEEQGLAFLDSRTTAETLGYSMARQRGLPTAERQVFLDTHRDKAFIQAQFQVLLATARKRGGAIGIAHPYGETLEILAEEVPKAKAAGIEFIPVSRLFDR